MEELKKNLPSDVKILLAIDASKFIKRSISNLTQAVFFGGLLVILVVFIFLRHLRGSFIISLTLPFSLIVAFTFMYLMGYSINMISLFSLAIAVGMVVDNAIVVYENIYRFRTKGMSASEAAVEGTAEVGNAITAGTLTTVAVFLPIIFTRGIAGVLFKQLGSITTVVILASLFTALTLTPMLSSLLLAKKKTGEKTGLLGFFYRLFENFFNALENTYRWALTVALNYRKTVITFTVLLFFVSLWSIRYIGTEFMPEEDQGEVRGFIELPLGTRVEKTDEVVRRIAKILKEKVPEREIFFMRAGATETGFGAMMGRKEGTNTILFALTLVPKEKRTRSNKEIAHFLEHEVSRIPGLKSADFFTEDPINALALGTTKAFTLEIYGDDFKTMEAFAKRVKKALAKVQGLTSITISREKGKPEIWIYPDRWKAAQVGLSIYQIGTELRTLYAGDVVSKYREKGKEYDIVVKSPPSYRDELSDLSQAVFVNPVEKWIPLDVFAEYRTGAGPVAVERKDQQRLIKVEADIYGRPLGAVTADAKKVLARVPIPAGVDYKFGGQIEEQKESFADLGIALLLATLLVYMVMAAQYESFLDPFIIMFSVPFAITGVLLGLLLTGTTLNLITIIGTITLVGIVVNNAIVLVDYSNILYRRGLPIKDALVTAGTTRLRPVLMTAITTICGMVPLIVMKREGSELWRPFGISVSSGLAFSTFITLIFVPVLYSILKARKQAR